MDIIEFNHRIWDLLRSVSQGIDSTLRIVVDGFGITMVQMRVLVELRHCQKCTIGELAVSTGSAPANASAMCKTLEKRGLVNRARNADDERIVLVSLTDEGKSLLQDIEEELSLRCNPLLAEFSDADFQRILEGMRTLEDIVNRMQHTFETSHLRR
ncbi:MAG: MarR family transcriptional regulator [Limnochordia bacterium]|jgi:DNA-binding MarR family transcriptional regulator|nr:MarR family transcriptional regulator [Limnochordia bacterium]